MYACRSYVNQSCVAAGLARGVVRHEKLQRLPLEEIRASMLISRVNLFLLYKAITDSSAICTMSVGVLHARTLQTKESLQQYQKLATCNWREHGCGGIMVMCMNRDRLLFRQQNNIYISESAVINQLHASYDIHGTLRPIN